MNFSKTQIELIQNVYTIMYDVALAGFYRLSNNNRGLTV
jgi:hypothetical protein